MVEDSRRGKKRVEPTSGPNYKCFKKQQVLFPHPSEIATIFETISRLASDKQPNHKENENDDDDESDEEDPELESSQWAELLGDSSIMNRNGTVRATPASYATGGLFGIGDKRRGPALPSVLPNNAGASGLFGARGAQKSTTSAKPAVAARPVASSYLF
jgi:hypothetical protein